MIKDHKAACTESW